MNAKLAVLLFACVAVATVQATTYSEALIYPGSGCSGDSSKLPRASSPSP